MRISLLVVSLVLLSALLTMSLAQSQPSAKGGRAPVAGLMGDVAHGRYLVEQVAMCFECHSPRDGRGNIIESQRYLGAPIPFSPPWPNDWALIAPRNRGLPDYDDAAAMRLLTQGAIARDGRQLKSPMPKFHMTPQDAADVIAFMRSLE